LPDLPVVALSEVDESETAFTQGPQEFPRSDLFVFEGEGKSFADDGFEVENFRAANVFEDESF
jgi:hypothetical protein